jgi:hypothetical protein
MLHSSKHAQYDSRPKMLNVRLFMNRVRKVTSRIITGTSPQNRVMLNIMG